MGIPTTSPYFRFRQSFNCLHLSGPRAWQF